MIKQFKPGTVVWEEYGHEGLYNKVPVSEIKFNCELPLTTISADSIYAVIAEGGTSNKETGWIKPGKAMRDNQQVILTFPLLASGGVAVQIKGLSNNYHNQ
ncbi:hypothetical protein A4H97_31380 [Niastella yeongjuensis]|uniref:Uncharacterized protein n=1 Tax=Niastella yeongjuensis TaxID=354355 RepID=A0A1V9EK04_9BACT|nr:hypothetical protein [Niastella yeongjuensis]OQP46264.1 hypothetical protein A4H97_31380 [Niastella yeongjuensis]SEP46270.1 alpha-glucosidase [Niastella yeongjuensis]